MHACRIAAIVNSRSMLRSLHTKSLINRNQTLRYCHTTGDSEPYIDHHSAGSMMLTNRENLPIACLQKTAAMVLEQKHKNQQAHSFNPTCNTVCPSANFTAHAEVLPDKQCPSVSCHLSSAAFLDIFSTKPQISSCRTPCNLALDLHECPESALT